MTHPNRPAQTCSKCEEQPAIVRVSATTLDGSVLDMAHLCRDCYIMGTLIDTLTIGDEISSPLTPADEGDPRG